MDKKHKGRKNQVVLKQEFNKAAKRADAMMKSKNVNLRVMTTGERILNW